MASEPRHPDRPAPGDDVTAPLADEPGAPIARGARVGRFVVLEPIGRGGMGIVVAAYDPVLDRRVAVKLLHASTAPAAALDAQLLREAQAMARLAHPNVVTVHDAGAADGRVYLAMEHVDGGTLRSWLAAAPRSWREIRDRFVDAGRGLAAAHDAGLVHRDFKPDNVLVGTDGRVRVTDFGLVRATVAGEATDALATTAAGTPRYMAPEQHRGARADARADQFAFAVALYEALWGADPFVAPDAEARAARVCAGDVTPPAAGDVPARIVAAVLRGLALDPADRHPSMHAFLAELARDPGLVRRRRLRVAAVATVSAALAAGAVLLAAPGAPSRPQCAGAALAIEPVWPGRRVAVSTTLARAPRSYAAATAARTLTGLDAWAGRWREARIDACRATHERGEQSAALLDLRMRCLDRRLTTMAALVEVLATPAATTIDRALAAVAGLPAVADCADLDALAEQVPPPTDPEARREAEAITLAVARATALDAAGRYREALAVASDAWTRAAASPHAPTLATAAFALAQAQVASGDGRTAEGVLREAIRAAAAARDDELTARAWMTLVFVLGNRLGRGPDALALRDTAEAAITRAGGGDRLEARWAHVLATVLQELGRNEEARHSATAAIAAWERLGEPIELARALDGLGTPLRSLGKFEDAMAAHRRSLALREEALGADHPECASSHINLGQALAAAGDTAGADAAFRRAATLLEAATGQEHADLANAWAGLADLDLRAGRLDDAAATLERGIALLVRLVGEGHPEVALNRNALGNVRFDQGRFDEAERLYRLVHDSFVAAYGAHHPRVAIAANNLGEVARARGDLAAAMAAYREAIAVRERAHGREHPGLAVPLTNLAEVTLRLGRPGEAEDHARRALALFEASRGPTHPILRHPLATLGEALVAQGKSGEAAPVLARALDLAAGAGDTSLERRARTLIARGRRR